MYRSLAYVGILATLAVAGTWKAVGQEASQQTTSGVVAKNHISDEERDTLMKQAMEKARQELESQKAARQAQEAVKAEREKLARQDAAAKEEQEALAKAARAKSEAADAATRKLVEEERMAKELAESEKNSSADKSGAAYDVKNLDALPPVKMLKSTTAKAEEKPAEKKPVSTDTKTAVKAEVEAPLKSAKPDDKKPGTEKKSTSAGESKVASSGEKSSGKTDAAKTSADSVITSDKEKVVIEAASTRDPASPITVKKTALPVGDAAREAEQRAARAGIASAGESPSREPGRAADNDGESQSVSGRVVGLMRSGEGAARILLQADDRRMVQVVVEHGDVPAPGAMVSVRGRTIGGGGMSPVISASKISIKSGEKMARPEPVEPPVVAVPPMPELIPEAPFMPPPMPPMVGGPMGPMGMPPMMPGPGPMMGPGPF